MKILILTLLAAISMPLQAAPLFEDSVEELPSRISDDNFQPQQLDINGMPEYPDDKNLRLLNIRQSNLSFYVDLSSISSSKKDNIVRLVIVAISPHGARTVTYEGMDCGYRRYQPYGFAGSNDTMRPFADQNWKTIVDRANGRYRRTLIDNYLCDGFAYAASREKILSRMKNLKPYIKE